MIVPGRDVTRPLKTFPVMLSLIIGLNVLVFMVEVAAGESFIERWAMTPDDITHGRNLETLLTSMFMHAGVLHLVGNMVFLVAFGEQLEANYLGPLRFLALYLLCGLAADALQIAVDPNSTIPNVGASGAIAGIMGAFIVVFPGDQIQAWVLNFAGLVPTRLSAGVFIGLWFLLQLISGFGSLAETSAGEGGVAYFAHIGGFIAGALLILPMGLGQRQQAL
jgi:membrane associated rhomboid family serine protease